LEELGSLSLMGLFFRKEEWIRREDEKEGKARILRGELL